LENALTQIEFHIKYSFFPIFKLSSKSKLNLKAKGDGGEQNQGHILESERPRCRTKKYQSSI